MPLDLVRFDLVWFGVSVFWKMERDEDRAGEERGCLFIDGKDVGSSVGAVKVGVAELEFDAMMISVSTIARSGTGGSGTSR